MSHTISEVLPALAPDPEPARPAAALVPDAVMRIPVAIQVVIGSARMPLSRVAQLAPGAIISLDQKLGAPASILVNGREVAKGELFVHEGGDNQLGITITGVAAPGTTGFSETVP